MVISIIGQEDSMRKILKYIYESIIKKVSIFNYIKNLFTVSIFKLKILPFRLNNTY